MVRARTNAYYKAFYSGGARAELGLMKEGVRQGMLTEERATITDAYFGRVDTGEDSPLGLHLVVGCESGAVGTARYADMEIIDDLMLDAKASRMEELIGKPVTAYVETRTGLYLKAGHVSAITFRSDETR